MGILIYEIFSHPLFSFFFAGFGTWIMLLIVAAYFGKRAGLKIDKQIIED